MAAFYKKYISALIHNPNLLNFGTIDIEAIQKENDAAAESAIVLLTWSKFLSKDQPNSSSVWSRSIASTEPSLYPPFHILYAFITGKKIDDFDKQEIIEHHGEATTYLKYIYESVEPDEATVKSKPMLVDLFGYVHELPHTSPEAVYFQNVGQFGATIKCMACKTSTYYEARKSYLVEAKPTDYLIYQYQHQCQHCGCLKMGEVNDKENLLETKCECGGYFRRDKTLLCPVCANSDTDTGVYNAKRAYYINWEEGPILISTHSDLSASNKD